MDQSIKSIYARIFTSRSAPDSVLIIIVVLLSVLGLIMVYSTTFYWSYYDTGDPLTRFNAQLRAFGIGMCGFIALSWVGMGLLRRLAVAILIFTVFVLFIVLVAGDNVFGAQRSLFNGSIQPSEFTKLSMVLYAAAWLAGRRRELSTFSEGLLPYGVVLGAVIGLVMLQPDFSTAFVLCVVMLTMYFMSKASIAQFLGVGLVFGLLFVLVLTTATHSRERLATFIAAFNDPLAAPDYHIKQLMLTMAGGGWFGHGIGASYQKFQYLPTPHTDSVVAVLVDEMGMLGLIFFLGMIGVFIWRGIFIAMHSKSSFGAYVAVGITVWIGVQTLMNLFSVLAMIPFTGVPVPFLSLGGSSLVSLLCACGVLVSISRGTAADVVEPAAEDEESEVRASARRIQRNGQFTFLASHDLSRGNRGARAPGAQRAQSAWGKLRSRVRRYRRQIVGGRAHDSVRR